MIITENRYSLDYFKCVTYSKPFNILVLVLFGMCAVTLIIDVVFAPFEGTLMALIRDSAFWKRVAATAFLWIMVKVRLPAFLKKNADRNDPEHVCRWYFSSEGIHGDFKSAYSEKHWDYDYSQVISASKCPKYYMLMIPGVMIYVLPDFFVQGSAEDFERLMHEKLGKKFYT